ncbi:MAG: lysophospholipid acyltransferase family protein [Smithellaceae bacterium]|nr:lysophospholipid acyltransferase family protein [Smithellaceae bacterium]
MLRSALLVTIGVAFTAYICLVVITLSLFSGGADRAHKVARIWAKILLLISSTRVTVIGGHNVLSKQPQVFMCNHQSDFDILVAMAHIPGQFRWLAKKELFRIPIFGPAMRGVGYIEIDRQDHQKAMKSLDEAAEKIRDGKSVMTFPEGTRSRDGQVKPFKPGTFYLAIKSGAPIVPVTIVGTAEIMPRRSLKVRPGRVTLIIDPPIDVSEYTIETRDQLIKRVRDIIMENKEKYGNP